jgi:hypothetical protein
MNALVLISDTEGTIPGIVNRDAKRLVGHGLNSPQAPPTTASSPYCGGGWVALVVDELRQTPCDRSHRIGLKHRGQPLDHPRFEHVVGVWEQDKIAVG